MKKNAIGGTAPNHSLITLSASLAIIIQDQTTKVVNLMSNSETAKPLNTAHDKRFSDAELDAEWQHAAADYTANFWDDIAPAILGPIRDTLHRFATHPHYFEDNE